MPDIKYKTYKFYVKNNKAQYGELHEIKARTSAEAMYHFRQKFLKKVLADYTFSEIVRENGEEVFKKINL